MAKALLDVGVILRLYALDIGGAYRSEFDRLGIFPTWVGRHRIAALRSASLCAELVKFRPHLVHSAHTYCNLYAAIGSHLVGAVSIGALRSSLEHTIEGNGAWTRFQLCAPAALIVNSKRACSQLVAAQYLRADRIQYVPNIVEVISNALDRRMEATASTQRPCAIQIARLVRAKRVDFFLQALSRARTVEPSLGGVVVGDGPERENLECLAQELGLKPNHVQFLGERADVAALIPKATFLVLSSETEGFPNVLLEAMAACVPTITTPAGDAEDIVDDSRTGYVVPFGDVESMASRMVQIAKSPELGRAFGVAGLERVKKYYSVSRLTSSLLNAYTAAARLGGKAHIQSFFDQNRTGSNCTS